MPQSKDIPPKPPAGSGEVDLKALAASVAEIQKAVGGVGQLSTLVTALGKGMVQMRGEIGKLSAPPAKGQGRKASRDDDDDDLEAMPRTKFAEHIVSKVLEALQPLNEEVEKTRLKTEEGQIGVAIDKAATRFKDFWDWRDEMSAVAKKHPDLDPDQLYHLARSSSPDKVKEVDAKYVSETKVEEKPRLAFGGLVPTSGGKNDKGTEKAKNFDDAFDRAWDNLESQVDLSAITQQ